ncbi:hypothetical protein [Pseudomonas gingeri]|uniref:hypothetical protein n=1 Tax=Pseudomonas gingeri TaxID=117681 RepID=UPI00159F7F11|nr:hypothetical protein [Pseudomonas gingeri]NWA04805.1 hypothetical protein [Pseudomonas gingeri]NWA17686.1 hypothetical protein [Pseudomonas gingeri]NWA56906.1 hypothetical protein [Pseudomonas gingeri]NWA97228.1 hypothetical protein [Pseudomonas gingeri]NWB01720.1 hypothetical protein [Pseudomonas gingeri]
MSEDPIPLARVYGAIEEGIRAAIPGLGYVGTMPGLLETVAVPAVVLELSGFEPADHDPGTGEVAIDARFEARAIVGVEDDDHLHVVAFVAAQLAVLLRIQTWGIEVEPAQFVRAERDWSRPELDNMAVWVVEWTQVIYLGKEEWPWPIESGGKPMVPDDDGNPVELEDPV